MKTVTLFLLLTTGCLAQFPWQPAPISQWIATNNLGGASIGYYANSGSADNDVIALGFFANGLGNNNTSSVQIGRHAGYDAQGADQSVFLGHAPAQYARNSSQSVAIGYLTSRNDTMNPASTSFLSVVLGSNAATSAIHFQTSVILGYSAAAKAQSAVGAMILGAGSGYNAVDAGGAVLIGQYAGGNAANLVNCVYIGNQAGYSYSRHNTLIVEGWSPIGQLGIGALIYGEFDPSSRLIQFGANKMGFFGSPAIIKPAVTGSRASGAALQSLLQGLNNLGLINDASTP